MIVVGILLIIIEVILGIIFGGIPLLLIAIALIPAFIAKNKGRDFWTWYVYGNLLWIFAIIHSIVIAEDRAYVEQTKIYSDDLKKCPSCGELVKREALVCRYCGHNFSSNTENEFNSSYSSSNNYHVEQGNYWYCNKCGCSNTDDSNWCKSCNSPRYTMETLSDKQKSDVKEFVDKQIAATSFEEIIKLQDSYFGTTSLSYMKTMLPEARGFDSIELYKAKLKDAIKEQTESNFSDSKKDKTESNEHCDLNTEKNENDLESELTKLKNLFDKQLITEEEYKAKKNQLLGL